MKNEEYKNQPQKLPASLSGRQATSYQLQACPGFVLLYSSLLASILLTVGLGIGSIVLKELRLSSIGKQSQIAFFAADTGIECALYWNTSSRDAFNKDNSGGSIACAENDLINNGDPNPAGGGGAISILGGATISRFGLTNLSDDGEGCVDVMVEKRDSLATVIVARGFNTCVQDGRRVERALRVRVAPPELEPEPELESEP
ncbi:MAG: hypothetical protein COV07_03325 [Candidatus Vogelbacteria bacterium CG10_big_fil_rev_8_21_14_0_10_45_14]|uniref:Type 4 fimbrial biogenesis protein PilX N-terminal domain-containing protein n=1 Tax=Candidatus Vogelbacteria bacterium CG10_big_fil_rev_8_21_14_0_10_45_14 TaxID=1975042 RepID=A0A2H0RJA2_9BACT|nr:MAG: hypothetical protein COV07_03325 [Candidatus Vogelbacteria bacterium CG10_big_fil_rev_8_21_14_0_10_45_14]